MSAHALEASLSVIRTRIRELGVRAYNVRLTGKVVTLRLPHWAATAANVRFLERQGLLEFFDLEASQTAGPSRTPLRLHPGSVQISCSGISYCPGVRKTNPPGRYYYLFKDRPALTGTSLIHPSVRATIDPNLNEPIVVMRFTTNGQVAIEDLTARLAERGRRRHKEQHFAIVVDGEILTFLGIDYTQYPNGIDAGNGLQISGLRTGEQARSIARLLRTPALPAAFEIVH